MGYNMKHGNSAVPFKELGSSPAKKKIKEEKVDVDVDVDKLIDEDFQDTEGTQYAIDRHNIDAHREEGSIKDQEKIIKDKY